MRNVLFSEGEYYHLFNRGVDHRNIIIDPYDLERFIKSLDEFNVESPIGSIYEHSFLSPEVKRKRKGKPLVRFACFCINPNHYHFLIEQLVEHGISKFMHRLSTGYTKYFNQKYNRSGVLFQGRFKAILVDSNEYLLRLSAYINLNDKVHKLGSSTSKLRCSSLPLYEHKGRQEKGGPLCKINNILDQFHSPREYTAFIEDSLADTLRRKQAEKELRSTLLE